MSTDSFPDFIGGLGDSGRGTADLAVEAIGDDADVFKHLMGLCFSQPYPIGMRLARVVQLYCEKNSNFVVPYLDEIIENIAISEIEGVRRSFLKIIADSIDFNLVKDNSILLQLCFDWLISPKESVSTRYYSIIICEKFCTYEPDLIPELKACLEFCLPDASKGFQNRALKVLKKLERS